MKNQIDIQYLKIAVQLIDLAIERGAYKGNEISTVSACRDYYVSIIQSYIECQSEIDKGE